MTEPSLLHYPCPQCGAELRFSPKAGGLTCAYCDYEELLRIPNAPEYPMDQGLLRDAPVPNAPKTFRCPKCAASYEVVPRGLSDVCPYCTTPAIDTPQNPLPPDGILPFRIDEKEAHELFAKWIGSLWFAPSELSKRVDANKPLRGIYIPYWLFDATARASYSGERGDVYFVTVTRTRIVNGRPQHVAVQEPRIRWTPVSGYVGLRFDALPVLAETSLPVELLEKIRPWPVRDAWRYEPKALCGFESKEYDRPLESSYRIAKEEMLRRLHTEALRDIGGDQQRIHSLNAAWSEERYQNVFVPVWTTHFTYRGKTYHYLINGVTGVVAGERPYSLVKIITLVILILGVLSAVFYFTPASDRIVAWLSSSNQAKTYDIPFSPTPYPLPKGSL